ncbi:hypothetical protein DMC30DRAFT_222610 [Rhodotorula diobovata]|uniref:Uncharacterized protein n=1 Tax=Rhodotorula diobovata TaxID=5288 RepID=A0A5C5FXX3_9BASI|nr:hypothetical protein DMC30DRAFT_222610 [Rhodotorula diobovata]
MASPAPISASKPERSLSPTGSSASTSRTPQPLVAPKKASQPPPKPQNIFSNDGSFLSKFKKPLSPEEQEKKEREEAIARKKALDERIKKRGKRPLPSAEDAASASKKAKEDSEEGLTEYQKEVKRLTARELKDNRARPLLK